MVGYGRLKGQLVVNGPWDIKTALHSVKRATLLMRGPRAAAVCTHSSVLDVA